MKRPFRLRRSILSVPGNVRKMIDKARSLPADVIMLDLEDSVPLEQKEDARKLVIESLLSGNWNGFVMSVRINPMDSPFAYRDLIEIAENCLDVIDTIVIPKVNHSCEVRAVDYFLTQIEMSKGVNPGKIGLEASIETAEGMLRVEEIAFSSERLETLVFGVADYSTSISAIVKGVSGHGDSEGFYMGHRWHFPISRMVMAAKAAGLCAIDAPYGDFRDAEGLRKSCQMSAALGCDGKWAIHPAQLEIINEVYTPSQEDIERSKKIVEAYESAAYSGKGALAIDGKMIDGATLRISQNILAKWKAIKEKEPGQS